jgi:hypothetical protein
MASIPGEQVSSIFRSCEFFVFFCLKTIARADGCDQNRDDVVVFGQLLSRAPLSEEGGDSGSGGAVVCGDVGRDIVRRRVLYLRVDM